MADFIPSKKTAQDFNNGVQFIDGKDPIQAETVNNLVESALYTQDTANEAKTTADDLDEQIKTANATANSAKQTAEGALSQVNQVLEDKTLLPDVQKNYYNLGAFDTFVSNGDGTGTILRQTGYLTLNGSEDWNIYGKVVYTDSFNQIFSGYTASTTDIKFSNLYSILNGNGYINNIGRLHIELAQSSTTLEQFLTALRTQPLFIQYKLPNPYTETVIENQPIHTLNQDGERWLREEWEKGLNLCNSKIETGAIDGATGQNYSNNARYRTADYIPIKPNTTYSFGWGNEMVNCFLYEQNKQFIKSLVGGTFTTENNAAYFRAYGNSNVVPMLNEGAHLYPHEDYYGGIVREKDLSRIQLFPEGVNPAQTIGGDWTSLGSFTIGSNTVYAWRRA